MARNTRNTQSAPAEVSPVNPAENLSGETPSNTPVETPAEIPAEIIIGKSKIPLEKLNRAIHSASCLAGRIAAKARETGHGRMIKDMSGGATLIPTLSALKEMKAAGLFGETESKDGKEYVAGLINQIEGVNLLIDGLAKLGIHKRG